MSVTKNSGSTAKRGRGRTRNWATVGYPESLVPDWQEKLKDLHIGVLISPLHKDDKNPDGTPKKPHHHILLLFDSVKTYEQAKEVCDSIGAVRPERIMSLRQYARYLCHLDNPEKAQYNITDVTIMGDVDYLALIASVSDEVAELGKIEEFIITNDFHWFSRFSLYCSRYRPVWFRLITSKYRGAVVEFFKSEAARRKGEMKRVLMDDGTYRYVRVDQGVDDDDDSLRQLAERLGDKLQNDDTQVNEETGEVTEGSDSDD